MLNSEQCFNSRSKSSLPNSSLSSSLPGSCSSHSHLVQLLSSISFVNSPYTSMGSGMSVHSPYSISNSMAIRTLNRMIIRNPMSILLRMDRMFKIQRRRHLRLVLENGSQIRKSATLTAKVRGITRWKRVFYISKRLIRIGNLI